MPSSAGFLSASWNSQGVSTESTGIPVQSPLHALDSEWEWGLCLDEHWGFVLCPQFSSPMKLIPVMQLNSCFFTRGFSVGFYNEHHQFLPQEQTLGLLGLAVYPEPAVLVYLTAQHWLALSRAQSQSCPKGFHSLGHLNAQVQVVSGIQVRRRIFTSLCLHHL